MYYSENPTKETLSKEESMHCARVLRSQPGDLIEIFDGKGNLYKAQLTAVGKVCNYKIIDKSNFAPKSQDIIIAVAPPKSANRFDFMVEKLVEIGVSKLFFLNTKRTERSRINEGRLQLQLIAACKQARQFYLPKIELNTSLEQLAKLNVQLNVCHCMPHLIRNRMETANPTQGIWCIGPEGDFSEAEIEYLATQGAQFYELGNSRLRTETAAIYVSSWLIQKAIAINTI